MRSTLRALLGASYTATVIVLSACAADAPTAASGIKATDVALARAGYDQPGMHRQYGTPVKLGNGMARTYVVLDGKAGQSAVELGIALDEGALDNLPNEGTEHSLLLQLPAQSPAPYQFAELDWNPFGHEPAGVYDTPHFDFHFYAISKAEWNSIDPSDPNYAANASNVPTGAYVPPFYIIPGPPAVIAVPHMGVHWVDVRSPELQNLLGNPAGYLPFTKTFIYGSWAGRYTFYEPMVTRAYLLSKPSDVVTPISTPQLYPLAGSYPTAYRVTFDPQAKEYRVALTALVSRP